MRSTLNSRAQLALLHKLRDQKAPIQKGFTLVELMIVVAIVGILSAVALPSFLGARNAAAGGAAIGEAVGLAKECAVYLASGGIGDDPSEAGPPEVDCAAGADGSVTSRTWPAAASGLTCLGTDVSAATQVTITVPLNGPLACAAAGGAGG